MDRECWWDGKDIGCDGVARLLKKARRNGKRRELGNKALKNKKTQYMYPWQLQKQEGKEKTILNIKKHTP